MESGLLEFDFENQPRVYLFDMLAKDECNLCHLPYHERRGLLKDIIDNKLLHLADTFELGSNNFVNEIEELSSLADSKGVEGLVLKSIDSFYETTGKRVNTWLKFKNKGMPDTLDLVPIGAFMGKGNRTGSYGSFLMASFNNSTNQFESICKLGTGFSWTLLNELT